MLFYRDETLDNEDDHVCPICSGELRKSFFWPALHDIAAAIDYAVTAGCGGGLAFFAVYRLNEHFSWGLEVPQRIGWISGFQAVILAFLMLGGVMAHYFLRLYLLSSYWERGYSLEGARYCPKCGNRFLVLVPKTGAQKLLEQGEEAK